MSYDMALPNKEGLWQERIHCHVSRVGGVISDDKWVERIDTSLSVADHTTESIPFVCE